MSSSILGKAYGFWQFSLILRFLRAVYAPFRRAFFSSRLVRFINRDGRADGYYASSLLGRVIDGAVGGVSRGLGFVWLRVERLAEGGVASRFVKRFLPGSGIVCFEFLFGAFVCAMFVIPHDYWSNSYALLASVGFMGLYLVMAGAGRRKLTPFTSMGLPFFLFALACCLSLLFSFDRGDSFRVLLFYVTAYLLFWVVVSDFTDRDRMMKLLGFIYAALILTSLYAIAQRFMGVEASSSFTDLAANEGVPGRVFSTLDNPNNFAEFLVMFAPLGMVFAMSVKRQGLRFVLVCCMVFPAVALLMTYSRSGWISMLLAAVIFVWYADKKLVPLLFLVGVAAIPFLPDSVMIRIASLFSGDSSTSYRLYTWTGVLRMLGDYLPAGIGLGPGSFDLTYPNYALRQAILGVPHSHMVYMELLVETGVLGFFAFMWHYLRLIRDSARALSFGPKSDARLVSAACIASLVGIAFTFCVEYVWYYPRDLFAFFILCGVSAAALKMRGDEA